MTDGRLCTLLASVTLAALLWPASTFAQPAGTAPACAERDGTRWVEPALRPFDDGETQPGFAAFRREVRAIVARRDVEAMVRLAHPDIKISFGGDEGLEAFRAVIASPDDDFWVEFGRILSMGGRFDTSGSFTAPYVFADWPERFDAFSCVAVVGRGVAMRRGPSQATPLVATLDHRIVEALVEERPVSGWTHVRLADGRSGFIASQYVRSPIDHRARFVFEDGRWQLVFYIAGD